MNYKCSVTTHGQRQLELDVVYPPGLSEQTSNYRLDLFIFTPAQLELTLDKYGTEKFLDDLKDYTRYMPPNIPLRKLVDPQCSSSPLISIHNAIQNLSASEHIDTRPILYELRMLVNIHHAEMRAIRKVFRKHISTTNHEKDIITRLETLFEEIEMFLVAFRNLHVAFMDTRVPDSLREALRWADEAISLKTEKELFRLHDLFAARKDLCGHCPLFIERLAKENSYRRDMNYETIVNKNSSIANEQFLCRESTLKKWAQSAMYMNIKVSKTAVRISHLLAGFAAAGAMAFALFAMVMTERVFPSYSIPWIILIIIAYMFKDRIKENLRSVFMKFIPRMVAGQAYRLIDPLANRNIGRTKSRIRFCMPTDLPPAVQFLYNQPQSALQHLLPQENVIHFQKEMRLRYKALARICQQPGTVTEIIRLKLDSWLREMDNPFNSLSYVQDGKKATVTARRVYHVILILQLSLKESSTAPTLLKYRLVLNRDGIIRTEACD